MARTIDQIYNAIIAEKQTRTELAGLTSVSATAVWRLLAFVVATVVWAHENFFDAYRLDLQVLIDTSVTGSGGYYVTALKNFQLGDTLTVQASGRLGYDVPDEAKKIIRFASFQEQPGGLVLFRVAKADANGNPVPLSAPEKTQVNGYMQKVRFAGVRTTVISENADRMRVFATLYYNSLIDLNIVKTAVQSALNGYFKNLDFDGNVYASKVTDALQRVPGVEDVFVGNLVGVSGLGNVAFSRIYRTRAGYVEPDTAPGFTLNDTITYVAQ